MLTSCPECRTTFRVGQAQLDAKRGLVRCGHCNAVFNAYDALLPEIAIPPAVDLEQATSAAAKPPAPAIEPAGERLEPRIDLHFDLPEPKPEPTPAPSLPPVEPQPVAKPEPIADLTIYRTEPDEAATLPTWLTLALPSEERADDILLSALPVPAKRSALARFGRGMAIVFLLWLIVLQITYFARSELAAWQPMLRPYMEAVCAPLHCTVPLPRDRDALRVESSSLETDPESPDSARLRVAFSNRAERMMDWPYLALTLTDVRDKALAQRVFAPRDYLAGKGVGKPGIAPGQEFEILLDLNLSGLSAAGYRVTLEYP